MAGPQVSRVTACGEAMASSRKMERARRAAVAENMVKLVVFCIRVEEIAVF